MSSWIPNKKAKSMVYLKQWNLFCCENNIYRPELADDIKFLTF